MNFMQQTTNKNYLLIVLLLILAFNAVDRLALGIVLQDIKIELALSDMQLGLLTGLSFALFYSLMGIPIAYWADRGNRVTIIAITAALWSAAVVLCAAATSFVQLMAIRVAVAIGEAGCIPPAHSLIADHFKRAERPRAVGIYMLGVPLSLVVGYFVAGWLNQYYGWRVTFAVLAVPGLLLAAIAWFTLKEPRLSISALARSSACQARPSLRVVWKTLWENVTFRNMLFCFAVSNFFIYGLLQWQPTFFIRSYSMQTGEVGTWFAVSYGLSGLVGTFLGGALASRYAAHNEQLQLKAIAVIYCIFGILSACVYVAPNKYLAFASVALSSLGLTATNGPFLATIQTLVPARMRAMSVAIIYLFVNLIGMGLGPLASGALSDALRPSFGDESLRYALLSMSPGFLWCTWHAWRASMSVQRDLATVQLDLDSDESAILMDQRREVTV